MLQIVGRIGERATSTDRIRGWLFNNSRPKRLIDLEESGIPQPIMEKSTGRTSYIPQTLSYSGIQRAGCKMKAP
jgi:hypothetical protein